MSETGRMTGKDGPPQTLPKEICLNCRHWQDPRPGPTLRPDKTRRLYGDCALTRVRNDVPDDSFPDAAVHEENGRMHHDLYAVLETVESFGCTQWEAK